MIEYAILTDKGEQMIKGVKVGEYFAVTPVMNYNPFFGGYCVTHLPTGRYLFASARPSTAVKCIKQISSLLDWDKCFNHKEEYKRAVYAVIAHYLTWEEFDILKDYIIEALGLDKDAARNAILSVADLTDEQITEVVLKALRKHGYHGDTLPDGLDTSREGLLDIITGLAATGELELGENKLRESIHEGQSNEN